MAQIGFTHKTEPVYDRFQDMRRAYEDAHGRTYAPEFLTVLMDRWENKPEGWNSSGDLFPNIGDKLLVKFPNGEIRKARYVKFNEFSVYLEKSERTIKPGFYPFSSSTCKHWKLNDFEEPVNETE